MVEPSISAWAAKGPRGPLAPPRKPDTLIVAVHGDILLKLPDEARTSNHEVAPVGRASVGNRKNTADGNLH